MINQIIETMKERIPKDPRTKKYFDKLVADGVDEDTAVDIMIYTWLKGVRKMTEISVKVNTRELTRQLNDLDLLQYQFKTNELKEFIKENLEVIEIGNS